MKIRIFDDLDMKKHIFRGFNFGLCPSVNGLVGAVTVNLKCCETVWKRAWWYCKNCAVMKVCGNFLLYVHESGVAVGDRGSGSHIANLIDCGALSGIADWYNCVVYV